MCANNILFLGKIKYCNHCGQKRSPQNWVQHLSSSPFGLLGNRKGENWRNPASSRFSGNGTSRASSWFDLSAIFQIVWLRSIVRGRLILSASGTIFVYIYIYYILPNISSSSTPRFYFLSHRPPLGALSCFKSMASEKFGPHLPTIIEGKHIKPLYELWGIDYAVEVEAPNGDETSETVRPGYCGAYTSHFEDGGLSFPLPLFFSWGACGAWDGFCPDGA